MEISCVWLFTRTPENSYIKPLRKSVHFNNSQRTLYQNLQSNGLNKQKNPLGLKREAFNFTNY